MKMSHTLKFIALSSILLGTAFTGVCQTVPEEPEPAEEPSIKKGKVLLGTYFDFSAATVNKTRVGRQNTKSDILRIGVNLTAGKMLSDRWGLLVSAGYEQSTTSTPITLPGGSSFTFEDRSLNYSIIPSVRYYTLIGDATYFFIQGSVSISRGTSESDEGDGNGNIIQLNFKTTGFGVGVSPGLSFFMTKKLSTELAIGLLGYSIVSGEDDKGNKTEARTFQSLLYLNSVSLGFVYYL